MRRIILALVISVLTTTMCHAWGSKGHKTVAALSLVYLTESARAGVESLLGGDETKYINAAVWADEIRNSRPETKPWHFVDIPRTASGYDAARDCKNGDCVVVKIDEFTRQLADRKLIKAKRVEALKFLIHFIGDIHQPLHGAEDDNDRGGNLVFVRIGGVTDNLHSWWDSQLVNKLGASPEDIAENLEGDISDDDVKAFSRGTAKDWAEESHKIARDFIYERSRGKNKRENPILLPDSYFDDALPIVRSRIALAAVRLAMVLNKSFQKPAVARR